MPKMIGVPVCPVSFCGLHDPAKSSGGGPCANLRIHSPAESKRGGGKHVPKMCVRISEDCQMKALTANHPYFQFLAKDKEPALCATSSTCDAPIIGLGRVAQMRVAQMRGAQKRCRAVHGGARELGVSFLNSDLVGF